jgi:uncharacterized cysteine cluster protein YcgN (CxxCxxCC family)
MMEIPQSCKGCGKCCIFKKHVNEPLSKYEGFPEIRFGKCEHLSETNECFIYNQERPTGCTMLEQGGTECISFLSENNG